MNVGKKLFAILVTSLVLVYTVQAAIPTPAAASTTPASEQDIQGVVNNLRENKRLHDDLAKVPSAVIQKIKTKMGSSTTGLSAGEARAEINRYYQGSAPAKKPAANTTNAAPAGTTGRQTAGTTPTRRVAR